MFNEHVYAHSLVGQLQLALSLIGSSEEAYQTFFKITKNDSEHSCIQKSMESDGGGYINHFRLIPFRNKLFFVLMDGPDEEIKKWYELGQKVDETSTQTIFPRRIHGFFIDGRSGASFARRYKDERGVWEEVGNSMVSKFQKWKESSEWNLINKVYLLLAERYFLQDDQENAFEHYDLAIKAAADHRFLHEEGLANVAAAKCCLHYDKKKEALIYYANAKDCYQRWGATALVNMIDERCRNL
jgi:tetratricopeptide (TPR) repeat protein